MALIELTRVAGDFGFEAKDSFGHVIKMDGNNGPGVDGIGVRPMQMLLMGLGGCAGIDVVSILKKQRQEVKEFKMMIDGQREPGVEPSLWKTVNLIFELKGNIELEKAKKACALSMDKYCSVAETLRLAGCTITWDVRILE